MENILDEIKEERRRQTLKFGEQNHSPMEWQGILMEEVGEVAKEAVDYHFEYPVKEIDGNKRAANILDQEQRLKRYRIELVQVAAVAVQMIECLDRNSQYR